MKPENEGNPVLWEIDNYQLQINYPYKLYFPFINVTKLETVEYYRDISSVILPYFKNRPATLHYFPRGVGGDVSFYKRDFKNMPDDIIQLVSYNEISQDKTIKVPVINTKAGLLYFASKGVIEFHLWNTTHKNFNNPDYAVFDLDIDSLNDFNLVLQASLALKEVLDSFDLKSFIKTSGKNGLHIYVPVKSIYSHKQIRNWVKKTGIYLMEKHPQLITINRNKGKSHSKGIVTIDYLQNTVTRSMIAPYSLRAHPKATVSTPLSWNEVKKGNFIPTDFTIKTILNRVKQNGDLFKEVLNGNQELPV